MSLESFTPFQGYFWLPGSPDIKVPGQCRISNEGRMVLSVLGTLTGKPIEPMEVDIPRVHGITERGKAVTLDGCLYRSRTFHIPGIAVADIHVTLLLAGHHFGTSGPLLFHEIAFHADGLDEWLAFAPILTRWPTESDQSAVIAFTRPEDRVWALPDGLRVGLATRWSAPARVSFREAAIAQTTWVSLRMPEPVELEELRELLGRFLNFVSFVLDQPLAARGVEVYNDALTERIGPKEHPLAIELHYATGRRDEVNVTRVSPPFPLLQFSDISERLDQVLGTWLENYERFAASFNLYFAARSEQDLFLENRFLMLVHALEALHRHTSTERILGDEEYAALCTTLRGAVPARHSKWLEAKLAYGNELSLRKRLKLLLRDFIPAFGGPRVVARFIDRTVKARNYLTHYDPHLGDKHPDAPHLHELCHALECVLQLQLGMRCGFSADEILEYVKRSELFAGRFRETQKMLAARFSARLR